MAKRKILILAANPKNTSLRRLDREVRDIEAGMKRSRLREEFEIVTQLALRTGDIQRALLDEQPAIVHFAGQGAGANGLIVEDKDGKAKLVSTQALARLFKFFKDEVECVVLNACYSEEQAEAIREHIGYVVGVDDEITNRQAIQFATGFYDALGAGRSYEDASEMGRIAVELAEPLLSEKKRRLRLAVIVSTVLSTFMVAGRSWGLLSVFEFAAYDFYMQLSLRAFGTREQRIVIVGINDEDLSSWGQTGIDANIPDEKLLTVLKTLGNSQPAVVGIDIFRELKSQEDSQSSDSSEIFQDLVKHLENPTNKVISTCHMVGSGTAKSDPPFKINSENADLVGFSDVIPKSSELIARRQLIKMSKDPSLNCNIGNSLNYRIALTYLQQQEPSIKEKIPENDYTRINVGSVTFDRILSPMAGYSEFDDDGFQILINYHIQDFEIIEASKILAAGNNANSLDELVKDNIVLVGYTGESDISNTDIHNTPVGKMAGVKLQAHMVQNIIGPVLDKQPMIRALEPIMDGILIIFWCFGGGSLIWITNSRTKSYKNIFIQVLTIDMCIFLGYWLAFSLAGWWLPLVPSMLGFLSTAGIIMAIDTYQFQKEN